VANRWSRRLLVLLHQPQLARPRLAGLGLIVFVVSAVPSVANGSTTNPVRPQQVNMDEAGNFHMDPGHSGTQLSDTLAPPLRRGWTVGLPSRPSYPLIGDGRVFVVATGTGKGGLYSYEASTGAFRWKVAGDIFTRIAYDNGKVFAMDRGTPIGQIRAIDAASGKLLWTISATTGSFNMPTTFRGVLYIGTDEGVQAVDESGGRVIWTTRLLNGANGTPAVSDAGVDVNYGCNRTFRLSLGDGSVLWQKDDFCNGNGQIPTTYGGRVYLLDDARGNLILDGSSGRPVGAFSAVTQPTFDSGLGFFMLGGNVAGFQDGWVVQAEDPSSGVIRWRFGGDGHLTGMPIAVNGSVYVISSSGKVYAVDEGTGNATWTGDAGGPITAGSSPTVGEGYLVVPTSLGITMFESGGQALSGPSSMTLCPQSVLGTGGGGGANPASDQAANILVNPVHESSQGADTLQPPLGEPWYSDFSGSVSYPVIAPEGLFVSVVNPGNKFIHGSALYALNPLTGQCVWGPVDLGGTAAFGPTGNYLAYESGRLFSGNDNGFIRAYDARNGASLWSTWRPLVETSAPLTARDGRLFIDENGYVTSLSETDGSLLWSSPSDGTVSGPTVTDKAVFVAYGGQRVDAYAADSGALLWRYPGSGSGGGGTTVAIHNGLLFASVGAPTRSGLTLIMDPGSGKVLRRYSHGDLPPAFAGNVGYFTVNGTLTAVDLNSDTTLWTFAGDGSIASPPVAANGYVYAGSSSGLIYGVRQSDGRQMWSANGGRAVPGFLEGLTGPLANPAIAQGLLVVPAGNRLVVFGGPPSQPSPSPSPAPSPSPSPHPSPGGIVVDGYGGLHRYGQRAINTAGSSYWPGWKIARGVALQNDGSGGYTLDGYGGIHPFGAAAPADTGAYWPGWDIARGIALCGNGVSGYTLDGFGGIHAFGAAPAVANNTHAYWPGWDIAKSLVVTSDCQGGYTLDGYGGVHAFGNAQQATTSAYWPGWTIARAIVLRPDGHSGYTLDGYGGVHGFGGLADPTVSGYWAGWDIARGFDLGPDGVSGYTLDGYGGVHPFGNAQSAGATAYWPGWDIARGISGD
jgi:outer membrane protein assembly factor BamB